MFAMEISLMWILIGLLYQLHNKKYTQKFIHENCLEQNNFLIEKNV